MQKDENDGYFPEMLDANAITIKFLSNFNLSELVGATEDQINQFVEERMAYTPL
jgi:hypothetical protein